MNFFTCRAPVKFEQPMEVNKYEDSEGRKCEIGRKKQESLDESNLKVLS